jgi:hypothetical protein
MEILGFNIDKNQFINQLLPMVAFYMGGVVIKKSFSWMKEKWGIFLNKIRERLPNILKLFIDKVLFFVSLLFTPLAKLIYLIIFSLLTIFSLEAPYKYLPPTLLIFIGLSLYKTAIENKSKIKPLFYDTFESLKRWTVISGNPQIGTNLGKPQPSLLLPRVTGVHTHSGVKVNNLIFTNGIIELDVFLEADSICNVAFRADFETNKYYLARFDTRGGYSDSFLRDDGSGWNYIMQSNHTTTPNVWHKMRVVISGVEFQLYDENGMIVSVTDSTYSKGDIGIRSEVGNVHVDNFLVTT